MPCKQFSREQFQRIWNNKVKENEKNRERNFICVIDIHKNGFVKFSTEFHMESDFKLKSYFDNQQWIET